MRFTPKNRPSVCGEQNRPVLIQSKNCGARFRDFVIAGFLDWRISGPNPLGNISGTSGGWRKCKLSGLKVGIAATVQFA
jgi:hypothetical protein